MGCYKVCHIDSLSYVLWDLALVSDDISASTDNELLQINILLTTYSKAVKRLCMYVCVLTQSDFRKLQLIR